VVALLAISNRFPHKDVQGIGIDSISLLIESVGNQL